MLGAALAGQGQVKYGQVERCCSPGYEELVQHEASMPQTSRSVVEQAGERVVQLYQHWGKPQNAVAWQNKTRHVAMAQ